MKNTLPKSMKTILALFIKYRYILLVVVLSLVASWPLFHAGLMPTHDGEYHLIRFYEFDKILREGTLYPRFAPDLNYSYGIPLFTYVYPLPNYVASLLHAFGASFLDSVKLNMVLASIIGALFFYLWAKRFWGSMGGLVSSVFYTFSPYHFVDIYIRGSVGEVWALGLFPGFLWAYTKFVDTKNSLFAALSGILLALIIFSHNILGLMFFIFAGSYMCLFILRSKKKVSLLFYSLFIILLSLSVSAIFWIPALFETQFVTGLQVYNISQNFVDVFQLLFPSWGTGFFDSNLGDQMSVQIGLANMLAIVLGIVSLLYSVKKKKGEAFIIVFSLVWFVVLFLFMLPLSTHWWQTIPLIHYFQFPWRLLSLVILLCSFLAGSIFLLRKSVVIAVILLLFVIATTYAYTQPAYYMLRNDTYYTSRSNFIDSTNSPGNVFNTIWNTTKTSRPKVLFAKTSGVTPFYVEKISSTEFRGVLTANRTTRQVVNISYIPGWYILLDGRYTPALQTKGLLSFIIPSGKHTVSIVLRQTPLELIASCITYATLFFLLLFIFLRLWSLKKKDK